MATPLGVIWSHLTDNDSPILEAVDFVELPGWLIPELADPPFRRLILHNLEKDWSLAKPNAVTPEWAEQVKAALAWTGSKWFSMHLGFASEEVRFDGHMLPVSPPLERAALLERIVANVDAAVDLVPLSVAVENLDYCPEGAYEHVCEPSFITEVVERTGCDLLLDLGHLQVTASWFDRDPFDLLVELPVEKTREIHISSPRSISDDDPRLDDAHEVLSDRDFELLGAALERCQPNAVVLEYSGSMEALESQVYALRKVLS